VPAPGQAAGLTKPTRLGLLNEAVLMTTRVWRGDCMSLAVYGPRNRPALLRVDVVATGRAQELTFKVGSVEFRIDPRDVERLVHRLRKRLDAMINGRPGER
jgi:hypothetical protein